MGLVSIVICSILAQASGEGETFEAEIGRRLLLETCSGVLEASLWDETVRPGIAYNADVF